MPRVASAGDLPQVRSALMSIINEVLIYNERAKEFERNLYTLGYLEHLLAENDKAIWIASEESKVTGFAITRLDNGPIWLSWFGVMLGWRGRGLGVALVRSVVTSATAVGAHKVWCDTRTNNEHSIPILRALQFQQVCRLDNHWCNQDYYLWQRSIEPLASQRHEKD